MSTQLKKPPTFTTKQEEAEFWDMHDVTEYAQSLIPVQMKYSIQPSQGITVRFRSDDLQALRDLAHKKRIGVTTLIRMAVLEYAEAQVEVSTR